jgi:hypothetical protein
MIARSHITEERTVIACEEKPRCIVVSDGWDSAHFFIIEKRQEDRLSITLSITGSFGQYGHYWGNFGYQNAAQALGSLDFDYAMGKLCPGGSLREFDQEASTQAAKREVIRCRRKGRWDRDKAREAWEAIEDFQYSGSRDLFLNEMQEVFGSLFWDHELFSTLSEDRYNPQAVGLWKKLWPGFIEQLRQSGD